MTNKTMMAAGLLALNMANAGAESNVTVYGSLSVVVESVRSSATPTTSRMVSNSSLIGFEGIEELDGGTRLIFQIEGDLDVDNGGGRINNRDSYVGLQGRFGRIKAGYLTSPMRGMGSRINFVPGSTSIANNIGIMATMNGQATGLNNRMQNSLRYDTPESAGLAAALIWAPGENRPEGQNNYAYGAGLGYTNGRVYAGYAYETRHAQRLLAGDGSDDYGHRVAARYTMGSTTVGIAFDRMASKGSFATGPTMGAGSITRHAWSMSAVHSVGVQDFMIHYAVARNVHCRGAAAATAGQCAAANRSSTSATQWSLMYQYGLSKRTMLQAYYSSINNQAAAAYDFDGDPLVPAFTARVPGADPAGVGFGIRHVF